MSAKVPTSLADLPKSLHQTIKIIDDMFDEVYLVGGAVRDTVLGKATRDLDFATPSSVDSIYTKLAANPDFNLHDEGRRFGTIAASFEDFDIQLTSYREESYVEGSRRPRVASAPDIDSDLSRRDFTINSIALSRNELVDPYDGLNDIKNKTIRAVGDPRIKFQEDPLRILRAFRLVSTLGFEVEEDTLIAAGELKNNLGIVSQERIGTELQKLMQGKYWADALNEMSDAGIINTLLKQVDTPYAVNSSDVSHEFGMYSANALEKMTIPQRWVYLVEIIHYAAKSSGVVSTSLSSIAENLVLAVQLSKDIKKTILEEVQNSVDEPTANKESLSDKDRLEGLKASYKALKKQSNPTWMIEAAKYYTEAGRQSLNESKYAKAREFFEQALDITDKNIVFILSWAESDRKLQSLRGMKPRLLSRLRYFYIVLILEEKMFEKYNSTDDIKNILFRHHKFGRINKQDIFLSIDRAIAHVYKINPRHIEVESFGEFLEKDSTTLTEQDISRYQRENIEQQLRDKNLPPKHRMRLYHQKMGIASKGREESELGLEYYDPFIDYLFNKMLCTKTIAQFYEVFEQYMQMAPRYQGIMARQDNEWAGVRNVQLTAASAHVYALTLARNISEKLDISRKIVNFYSSSSSNLNAARYRIYTDWFGFAAKLLSSEYSEHELSRLLDYLISCKQSINYVDTDEEYLERERPGLIEKRVLLKDSLALVAELNDRHISDITITNKDMLSLQTLLRSETLPKDISFDVYKNIISKNENEVIELSHIEREDREITRSRDEELSKLLTGESETLEYKSSWRMDINKYIGTKYKQRESSDEIAKSSIKNIAGMMNKRGGMILIGVEDNCEVIGLENTDFLLSSNKDPRKILDNLQKKMREDIINALGVEPYSRLQFDTIKYKGKLTVLKILVPPADKSRPCFYKENGHELYFVRSGTTCENLGVQAAIDRMRG